MNSTASGCFFELLHHGLQPLLEVAAIARAGQQRAHVERSRSPTRFSTSGTSPSTILRARPFGDRRLADARHRRHRAGCSCSGGTGLWIVRSHLAARGRSAGRSRPALGLLVEVDAEIGSQRLVALAIAVGLATARHSSFLADAGRGSRRRAPGARSPCPTWLMPCADEVDRVEPRHALLLEERRPRGSRARQNSGHQHVGARHLLLTGQTTARGLTARWTTRWNARRRSRHRWPSGYHDALSSSIVDEGPRDR
jgi:hypothetical protein